MSDFEKYIEAKYPNRSPKILFQKFKDIDGTLFYGIKEVEDQAEAWNHQQAQIDELEKQNQKLQKQFNFLLDKNIRDESAHASLKLRVMSVSHLMDKAAEDGAECVDIGSLYDVLIKDGDLDQALRGEHENSN